MRGWSKEWRQHFFDEAELISRLSKDPSTKCGACIVRPDKTIVAKGYNGFPRGMDDSPARYADRAVKYPRVVHAEVNAILSARCDLSGCCIYVWPFLTCERCAVMIAQAGIVEVLAPWSTNERWTDSWVIAHEIYAETGITVTLF